MDGSTELPLCDNEPIHIPGSIQPHGVMLVAARHGMMVWQAAGDVEDWLGIAEWHGAPLASLLGTDLAARVHAFAADDASGDTATQIGYIGQLRTRDGILLDVSAHTAGLAGTEAARDMVVVELEPAGDEALSAARLLDKLDSAAAEFQRAATLETLCRAAAIALRDLNGFDRVMIYRFGDDEAGACWPRTSGPTCARSRTITSRPPTSPARPARCMPATWCA